MHQLIRTTAIVLGAIAIAAAAPSRAFKNPMTVVVGNGPFAGTYKLDDVICVKIDKSHNIAATFKEFSPKTAKSIGEGAVSLDYPEKHEQRGDVHAEFGIGKAAVDYDVYNTKVTLAPSGKGGTLVGAGKTKEGIALQVTATCASFDTM